MAKSIKQSLNCVSSIEELKILITFDINRENSKYADVSKYSLTVEPLSNNYGYDTRVKAIIRSPKERHILSCSLKLV